MINIVKRKQPNLVDHSLLKKVKVKVEPNPKIEISTYINWIGLAILFIIGYMMYQRYRDKDKTELEKQNTIIEFNQYINEKLTENK